MNRLLSCSVVMSTIYRLVSIAVVLNTCSLVFAQTVNINYTDRGTYIPAGEHKPADVSYIVGDFRGTTLCGPCVNDIRNFFVFDLSSVNQPVASAKLALLVPGTTPGFASNDGKEAYELHDVTTPIASLVGGTGGVAAHSDLGSGVVYGIRSMSATDMGNVIEITMNPSAIAAMNSNHGLFAIGGSITSLDGVANNEYAFGFTGSQSVSELRLTLVPEPSTLLLLGIGAISLLGYRKAKP